MAKLTRRQKLQQQLANDSRNVKMERKFYDNKVIHPRNSSQEDALDSLRKNTLTILTGAPGTSKTLLSVYVACEMLDNGEIDKIYYVKPIIQTWGSAGIGFLPGTEKEKTAPDIAPVKDALNVFMNPGKADYLLDKKIIEFLPIDHLRGRSLNNCFVIMDEAQNTLPHSILTVLTRIGSSSKIALIGDIVQRDLSSKFGKDGLSDAVKRLKTLSDCAHIEFGFEDICRSSFVKSVIYKYADLYQ